MFILNSLPDFRSPLDPADAAVFDPAATQAAAAFIAARPDYAPTPLVSLPGLAQRTGVASIQVKDESARFGLGSFKALGGAYAVIRLALEAAEERLGRPVTLANLDDADVRAAAS